MGTITSTQNANQFVGLSWLEWFEIYPYIWLLPGNVLQTISQNRKSYINILFLIHCFMCQLWIFCCTNI